MREPRPKQCKRKEGLVLFHITVQIAGKTLPQELEAAGHSASAACKRGRTVASLLSPAPFCSEFRNPTASWSPTLRVTLSSSAQPL